MERLRTHFTRLFIYSALIGIASFMVSCNQQTDKQKHADKGTATTAGTDQNAQNGTPGTAANQQPQNLPGNTGGQNTGHPGNSTRPAGNNPNSIMLNTIANKPSAFPGPMKQPNMSPEQKKAIDLITSGSKKAEAGDQEGAIADFTESLNQYKMPVAYVRRGFAELVSEDYTSAINDFNETIKLNPTLERAYFGRGVCRFENKDFDGAEEDMKKFTAKDKTTAIAYNYLAGIRFMKQDFKGALENYDMVVKLDPKFQDIYTNRGMMKHYLNDLKGAVEDYDKALTIDPKNATAYNNRGGAKLNQGDSKGALEDFNKAISLKDDYADAFDNRGKAKINLKDITGACADFRKALSLGLEASQEMIDKYCK